MYILANSEYEKAVVNLMDIVKDELNIKNIEFEKNTDKFNIPYLTVNFKTAGSVLKGEVQALKNYVLGLNDTGMRGLVEMYREGEVEVPKFGKLSSDLFMLNLKPKEEFVILTENNVTLVLDTTLDKALMLEGAYRELVRTAQVLRKEADFNIEDRIEMDVVSTSSFIREVVEKYKDTIKQEVLVKKFNENIPAPDIEKEVDIADNKVILKLKRIRG